MVRSTKATLLCLSMLGLAACEPSTDRGTTAPSSEAKASVQPAAAVPRVVNIVEAVSRYGRLEAPFQSASVLLDGRTVATAEGVDPTGEFSVASFGIVRAFTRGAHDIFLLEAITGGMMCPNFYLFLETGPAGLVRTSPPFGTCSPHESSNVTEDGVAVMVPQYKNRCWVYADGRLEERRCFDPPRESGEIWYEGDPAENFRRGADPPLPPRSRSRAATAPEAAGPRAPPTPP